MATVLATNDVVEFRIAETFSARADSNQEFKTFTTQAAGGGVTLAADQTTTGNIQIFVNPNGGRADPDLYYGSGELTMTNEMVDAHEFGHADDLIAPMVRPKRDPYRSETWIDDKSVMFENAIRSRYSSGKRRATEAIKY